MIRAIYSLAIRNPRVALVLALVLTVFFASQFSKIRWETDARVYMPKGHPAIIYDEKVEHIFGAKDSIIISVVNDDDGVFNHSTLARIARVTEQVAALPGVMANRLIDVASLSTVSLFVGTETAIGAQRLMPHVPDSPQDIEALRKTVYDNADLFVGNIVSADGKAAMIRAKLKEGAKTRYETYFAIRRIVSQETGDWSWSDGWWSDDKSWEGNEWSESGGKAEQAGETQVSQQADAGAWEGQEGEGQAAKSANQSWAGNKWTAKPGEAAKTAAEPVKDRFYLAGRPVIEVTAGLEAMKDVQRNVPLLLIVLAGMLFLVFRTGRGVVLPMVVMAAGIVWTMGTMALLDVPMYTISTMLPVILVAVGIGDAIHVMSHYYDVVLQDPHRDSKGVVADVMENLGAPLITTSATTAIGFLSLWFAEMPPFKVFGLFTVLGIFYCWLLSVTFLPATLSLMRPKVGGYLQKRQHMRVSQEQSPLVAKLVALGEWLGARRRAVVIAVVIVGGISLAAASKLYVDSSWMSDFRDDNELTIANKLINEKFSGTISLNVVIDGGEDGALKRVSLLRAVEDLQAYAATLPYVGDSLSIVDYLKTMNKNLNAGDPAFDKLPDSDEQVAEFLFLFSISGRPEELDEVVDFNYRQANVNIQIKSDHTAALKTIIDGIKGFVAERFAGLNAEVNLAGSGNNSYLWADLLIGSQTTAIVVSKIGILLLATMLFRSALLGFLVVLPVAFTTLVIAGVSGIARVPLDVSTALAAGVAIGVGVDYAVHFIYRYLRSWREKGDSAEATRAAMRGVGKTIVFNAVVVTAGFSVLFWSLFPPHVKLGYFVAAYMVLSCIAALVLLPTFFSLFSRRVPREETDPV